MSLGKGLDGSRVEGEVLLLLINSSGTSLNTASIL